LICFKASHGFIQRFTGRHNIIFKNLSGEAASVDENVVNSWNKTLKILIKNYDPSCLANIDETGFFYQATRGKSFVLGSEAVNEKLRGTKHSKARITLLVGAYMNGDKLPLLVIGKSEKPRCFKNARLPCMYRAQTNAWMNCGLFHEYLAKLDNKLSHANKKIIMFIDNCAAHSKEYKLQNQTIKFFPPNVTS
jgi:hypothetical protein